MADIKAIKRHYSRIEKRAAIEGGWFDIYKSLRTLAIHSDLPNKQELFELGLNGLINLTLHCEDDDLATVRALSEDMALYSEHMPENREDLLWL